MASADIATIQHGIKTPYSNDMTQYALFLGGANATHDVLATYDPLRTGYGRLFMVRKPVFLVETIPNQLKNFKHLLEYGNVSVDGITDISMNFEGMTGGYVGKSIEVPMVAQDGMTTFTVTVYEFSGSPVRSVIDSWINGTSDVLSGLRHYNGATKTPHLMANETAEFIYVATDNSGEKIEYACLLAGCFPETINLDAFNYQSGTHNLVSYAITFHCIRYQSLQINRVAQALLDNNKVLANSLNFYSGIKSGDIGNTMNKETASGLSLGVPTVYNVETGKIEAKTGSVGTTTINSHNIDLKSPMPDTILSKL